MTAFVGRQQELQRLQQRLDSALSGKGVVVFITGEAGAGKSTLVKRFLVESALRAPEARIISGDCSEQYGSGEPYQPFVETMRDLVSGGDSAGRARFGELARKLAPHWLAALPVAGELIAATMTTAVELKQTFGGGTATAAPPSEEALFFQYTELLLAAAAERSIVLFLDDLHWADHASVSLLGHIARKIADKPVLIVGTYRPADVEVSKHPIKKAKLELERYGVAEELALETLETNALAELIREELDAPPAPELVEWLEQRTDSNPLFFCELLTWMVDQGIARKHHDEWVLAEIPEEIEIPRSAESVIEKRLNRLDPEVYRVLEYASVEGDEFDSTVLARLLDMDELELEEVMDPLVRVHKLVRLAETRDLPNGDITSVYYFSHSLFQDVLHRNLQGKRRILLHRKVAGILEEIYADDKLPIAHRLALHYDEGRQQDQACQFALQAADRASVLYAHRDAIGMLRLGLKNSRTDEQKVEVLSRLGEQNRRIGRYSEALSRFGDALQGAEVMGDRVRAVGLKRKMVLAERDFGRRPAQELHEELTRLAREARELGARGELCRILWQLGGTGEAVAEALEIAKSLEDREVIAKAHYELGIVLTFGEDPAGAVSHLAEALTLFDELGDKYRRGLCHNVLAVGHLLRGKYQLALEQFKAAATIFDELGDPVNEASVRNNLAVLLIRSGDWDEAKENLNEALRLALRLDATARLLFPLQNLAEMSQARGDWDAARMHWGKMLDVSQETGYWNDEITAHCGLAIANVERGDNAGARVELEAAAALMENREVREESREAMDLATARLAAAEGDDHGAIEYLERAQGTSANRDRYLWAEARLFHGEILSRTDEEEAASLVREALEVFEELGAKPLRDRARDLLSHL